MTEIAVAGPLLPGDRLGRYRLLAPLGQGEMGTVYLGVADGLGDFHKLVVLKELRQELSHNKQLVSQFLQKANLAAGLNHPNIVHTQEAGQTNNRYFLAMEFLDGQALDRVMARADTAPIVSLEGRIQLLCDVLAGLQYAHQLSDYSGFPLHIVHHEICPKNIFVTFDGQAKVLDFGFIKPGDDDPTGVRLFTGHAGYAAPEQLQNREAATHHVDLFAVGVVLWEMIAQRRFAPGPLTRQAVEARLAGAEPRIAQVVPDVDPRLAAACDRALQPDPEHRFTNADEFRGELLDYLASRSHRVDRDGLAELMRTKFADERAAMHQLIHRGVVGQSDLTHSGQRLISPASFGDDVTEKVDLSEFVKVIQGPSAGYHSVYAHRGRRDADTLSVAGYRPLAKSRVMIGAAVGGIALGLYLFSGASNEPPEPRVEAMAPAPGPAAQATRRSAVSASPALAGVAGTGGVVEPEVIEVDQASSTPTRASRSRSSRSSSGRHASRSTRRGIEASASPSDTARLPADGAVLSNPLLAPEAGELGLPTDGRIRMGMDLDAVQQRPHAADFEDPFAR